MKDVVQSRMASSRDMAPARGATTMTRTRRLAKPSHGHGTRKPCHVPHHFRLPMSFASRGLYGRPRPPARSRLYYKFAITHDDTAIYIDRAAARDDIYVDRCVPIGSRKLGIRIAKGNVQARHLFVLQEITRKFFEAGERTDSKFAGAIAVGNREQVVAQLIRYPGIFTGDAGDVTVFHSDDDRMLEHTILRREVVAQDITDEHPIDGGWCSEDLAFGQVAPFSLLMVAPVAGGSSANARGRWQSHRCPW